METINCPAGASTLRTSREKVAPVLQMLDYFERHDQVEGSVAVRQLRARGLFEREIGHRVVGAGIFDGLRRDIDARDALGHTGKLRGSVARAAPASSTRLPRASRTAK